MNRRNSNELSNHIRPLPSQYSAVQLDPQYNTGSTREQGAGVKDYLGVLLMYRRLILSISALVLFFTMIYSFLATPKYTAVSSLKIGAYSPLLQGAGVEDILRQETREQGYINTQVELLSSLSLADRVLSEDGIAQALFGKAAEDGGLLNLRNGSKESGKQSVLRADNQFRYTLSALKSYLGRVTISPVRRTSLVQVSVTTTEPELSAKIANAHARGFIDHVRAERQRTTVESLVFLKSQAAELANKVAVAERAVAAYAEENAIVSVNKDENIVVRSMSELSRQLTEATARRIGSESKYDEVKNGKALSSTSLDDDSIEKLRSNLKEVEAEQAELGRKFKPGYPKMLQLAARIKNIKSKIIEQRKEALAGLEAQYQSDVREEEAFKKQLDLQKSKAFELSRREVHYNILKREYESLRDLHQSVLRQLKEAQISSESLSSNVIVADRAAPPLSHSSPKRMANMIMALIAGPMLGFGAAFLLMALDNTIKTPEDLQKNLGVPSLGVVPQFTSDQVAELGTEDSPQAIEHHEDVVAENDITSEEDDVAVQSSTSSEVVLAEELGLAEFVTVRAPRSVASECFRSIRTGILLSSADNPPRVILVSSAKKGEGKTTIVTNLAITLAQSSHSVVLVDADLRRPNVHRCFGLDPLNPGLVEFLTGQKNLEDIVIESGVENLKLIPAGTIPPNPSELVGSRRMAETLQQLSEEYDYVLVDGPPVMPVTDSVALSRLVDGVVMVVRGHNTQKDIVSDACDRFRQVGGNILGAILNDVNVQSGHNYYYYRERYADYYEDRPRSSGIGRKVVG